MGVEIEITPAGKATKRLTLLSGGEKSLTALAFLFAVFLARPCPFYILDEVEAALDDLNIDRFLGVLRRFSDRAQFIVVTHQKRTMEAADCLYGVSMAGNGVSKVVSRRLPPRGRRPSGVSAAARREVGARRARRYGGARVDQACGQRSCLVESTRAVVWRTPHAAGRLPRSLQLRRRPQRRQRRLIEGSVGCRGASAAPASWAARAWWAALGRRAAARARSAAAPRWSAARAVRA